MELHPVYHYDQPNRARYNEPVMAHEIDFLAVGENSNSGDAICIRYGTRSAGYKIHVVDGGFRDTGDAIIQHLTAHYGAPTFIDHVVLSHPDNDHAGGLIKVLETYNVGALWMNRPWLYADEIVQSFKYAWTADGLRKKLRDLYSTLVELEEIATRKGIPINEAFQGTRVGDFYILAPSRARFLSLVPQFDKTPTPKVEVRSSFFETVAKTVASWIKETWTGETLSENPEPTSASNESSLVQLGILDGKELLLTGDVGPEGLTEAANYLASAGYKIQNLTFVQVPHHGSRRNVTPTVLNWWLGPPLLRSEDQARGMAFCSAAKNDSDHPRKKVINAFTRRGYPVHTTNGEGKQHFHELPLHSGWGASYPLPFSHDVEE